MNNEKSDNGIFYNEEERWKLMEQLREKLEIETKNEYERIYKGIK